ncbi:MAG: hypothetical protein HYW65_03900 [Candidatus Liptonbacteria bacterium]|nr:hypothetical protein [Candidatus Liptonbacteria bacterium]
MNSKIRTCQNCKQQFTVEPEDFQFYERVKVPPPTFCPDCRLQRRMTFRNERSLYKRTCDLCKKSFVSMYSPDPPQLASGEAGKPFTVYCKECWYSDNWDPLAYGQDYDWNKSFFEQFQELMRKVPRIGIMHIHTNINADYANYIADNKNVYLSHSVIFSENVYHSRNIDKSKDIFDCFYVKDSERCYEDVDCSRIYRSKYLVRSRDCLDSAFLFDCVNCQSCFMSSNLRNKQFVFRNEQLTKEQYAEAMARMNMGSHAARERYREEFQCVMRGALHKFGNLMKITACIGNNIENSKNVRDSFDLYDGENLRFCMRNIKSKDSYDVAYAASTELVYEAISAGFGNTRTSFVMQCDANERSAYCEWCQSSTDLFGCTGLRKRQYCILNKQYSQSEYEKVKAKIIEQMNNNPYKNKEGKVYRYGEFFPAEISPFAYNETMALELFPLGKEDALAAGYSWHDPEPYPHTPTLKAENLPDDIKDVDDSIRKEIIGCPNCGRAYRIMPAEFDFLKREGIALPRKCVECRHKDRFALRNPLKLWHRQCMCDYKVWKNSAKHTHHPEGRCPNEFETSYAPDRPEIVYCESCYQSEVA